ncbi:MAG: hypothetical protein HYY25_08845 [Candidatus Wallbacteria bacterium]|nr:hypothetical protein [Candidatus Wallbacteria bacterium]
MSIKTFGDLRRHLGNLDLEPLTKQLASWFEGQLKAMPADVVALHLEWDLVGGDVDDEIVADLYGFKPPGLDPEAPGSWDWSSDEDEQFQFIGMGAIWSESVEILTDDEVPAAEEQISATIDTIVRQGVEVSQNLAKRVAGTPPLRFFWSRDREPLREYSKSGTGGA